MKYQQILNRVANLTDSVETEIDLWSGRYSGKSMIGIWITAFAMTSALVFMLQYYEIFYSNRFAWIAAVSVILSLWGTAILFLGYHKFCRSFKLSNQKLSCLSGIVFHKRESIELLDVEDITYRQGPVQAMLGVGHIRLCSNENTLETLTIYGVADVREVAEMIDEVRSHARRIRGLAV